MEYCFFHFLVVFIVDVMFKVVISKIRLQIYNIISNNILIFHTNLLKFKIINYLKEKINVSLRI